MITFEDLVGDQETFAGKYRDNEPLLRKGVIKCPEELLDFRDLDELLASEAIRPPYVRISRGGTVREGDYTRVLRVQLSHIDDVPDPAKLIDAFQTGATLTWNSMNHYRPRLRSLTTMLSKSLGCRTDVVAFLTQANIRGFAPHLDSTEVFVIQVSGSKKWTVWPTLRPRPQAGRALDVATLGDPFLELTLEPGDCLYLPWGTPHVAYSGNQISLHLSVTAKPQTWAEVVASVLGDVLSGDEEFLKFPVLSEAMVESTAAKLRELLPTAAQRLGSVDAETTAKEQTARALPDFGIGTGDFFSKLQSLSQELTDDDLVVRGDPDTMAVVRTSLDGGKIAVDIGPRTYAMPDVCRAALEALNTRSDVTVEELGDRAAAHKFVRMLTQAGFLDIRKRPLGGELA